MESENSYTYKTINKSVSSIFRDRNSKFLGFAFPVSTENEISDVLAKLKKDYHDARHFCYAYILGADKSRWRANDDGEPSGSAGLPIYNQCLSLDLTNIFVVVVRYFGGTKLGVPGLINAYKTATKMALDEAEIVTKFPMIPLEIHFEYSDMNAVMTYIKQNELVILEKKFSNKCSIMLQLPEHKKNELKKYFNPFSIELFWGTE